MSPDPTVPEIEHDFQRTIPTDGLWCQRCGLSHAQWTAEPCSDRIHPSVEASIVALQARAVAAETLVREVAQLPYSYSHHSVDELVGRARALLASIPSPQAESTHD